MPTLSPRLKLRLAETAVLTARFSVVIALGLLALTYPGHGRTVTPDAWVLLPLHMIGYAVLVFRASREHGEKFEKLRRYAFTKGPAPVLKSPRWAQWVAPEVLLEREPKDHKQG